MAGKAPSEQQLALNEAMQKNMAGELNPQQQSQFWDALAEAHKSGITGTNAAPELYQYVKSSMKDTGLPEELRRQLAEAYYIRQGTPYVDPTIPYTQPDTNGMDSDGGQRTPTTVDDWQGSGTHDEDGNVIPGSAADPATYAYQPPATPPGTTPPGGGGNGAGGGAGGPGAGGNYAPQGFGGYEGPNAALYAQQFGNLLGQGNSFQQAQQAAAIRRAEQGEQAPVEFDYDEIWKDLPEVRVNQAQPGETPYSWMLNPAYGFEPGKTSNADMLRAVMGGSQFSDKDRDWFNKSMADGKLDSETWWSGVDSPRDIISKFSGYSGDNQARMEKAINLAFARSDMQSPEGGGPPAPPPGYASPRPAY